MQIYINIKKTDLGIHFRTHIRDKQFLISYKIISNEGQLRYLWQEDFSLLFEERVKENFREQKMTYTQIFYSLNFLVIQK